LQQDNNRIVSVK